MWPSYFLKHNLTEKPMRRVLLALVLSSLIGGCATDAGPSSNSGQLRGKITSCKSGDTVVASQSQCMVDDAACYELGNGQWCTGDRSSSCPAGSTPLVSGSACPPGTRCITISDSLTCGIQLK